MIARPRLGVLVPAALALGGPALGGEGAPTPSLRTALDPPRVVETLPVDVDALAGRIPAVVRKLFPER